MNVVQHLYRLGGVASRRDLLRLTSRAELDRALRSGEVLRDGHGRYAVPVADEGVRVAAALNGVASHRTAAAWWGWAQKVPMHTPEVTVPRNRKIAVSRRHGVTLHWGHLADDDVDGQTTSRPRTVVDCMRSLPFDEALAIADSALRSGSFRHEDLVNLASLVVGPGAARCRRVAEHADGRADNPFESVLRALSLDVPALALVPQVVVEESPSVLRPDLVDRERRLIVEADSFAWHGSRRALRKDCRRYNRLVVLGFVVLRFSWEDVMHEPAYVQEVLAEAADVAGRRAQRPHPRRRAA